MAFANCTLCALHIHWHPDKLLEFHICSVCLYCIPYFWYICIFWATAWQVKRIPVESNLSKSEIIQSMGFCWHANKVILIIKIHAQFRFKKSLSQNCFTPSQIIVLPCPSFRHPASQCCCETCLMWPWRVEITQPLKKSCILSLPYFTEFCQTKPVAEVWSKFWSWSFVKILKLSPALTAETSCCQL